MCAQCVKECSIEGLEWRRGSLTMWKELAWFAIQLLLSSGCIKMPRAYMYFRSHYIYLFYIGCKIGQTFRKQARKVGDLEIGPVFGFLLFTNNNCTIETTKPVFVLPHIFLSNFCLCPSFGVPAGHGPFGEDGANKLCWTPATRLITAMLMTTTTTPTMKTTATTTTTTTQIMTTSQGWH